MTRYLDAVLRRASVPMEAEPFEPDWQDQPRSHKIYPGAPGFPLPDEVPHSAAPLGVALLARPPEPRAGAGAGFTVPLLGGMLRHSYGWLSRRLQVTADPGQGGREAYAHAAWARGSAAGGGLYPCEIYWVCGPGAGPLPGVYHYNQPAHALRRLAAGDVSPRVREALGGVPTAGRQFLLVTVRFWQNAFKYGEFSYHCVTMDLGCLLRTWQTWAAACGIGLRPRLWYDEPALDRLLGLDPVTESVLAVVPLPWRGAAEAGSDGPAPSRAPAPRVAAPLPERSRTVLRFPAAEAAHLAATYDTGPPPGPEALAEAAGQEPDPPAGEQPDASASAPAPVPLPAPSPLGAGVAEALAARRSSFGRFSAHRPLSAADLAALLQAAAAGRQLRADGDGGRASSCPAPALTRLAVFAQHVAGAPAGLHLYDSAAHALVPLPGPAPHPFLQRSYTLNNYNLEQAAAVLVVLARPHAVVAAAGPRGHRLLNAEAGAVAQAAYLAAASLGTGCGAALGFDYEALHAALAPAVGPDTWPLLLLMAGHERCDRPRFDASLAPNRPGGGPSHHPHLSPSPRTDRTGRP
ncbi:SagB/ThcOx family dehydrogenase [Streptomyces spirodelae]|uniref:SagB family peptide dehydrogenase n=1 Tax=Streptomyces spirodelae TaxID=2812904 RepID=A0ABS3WTC8_9ACTN|nr:SagB/ThcOx family dehydrogenase [Streptomyces spirodelae]MBO8186390.1 SagB family peptide dehydrogenase [Streptomyces spirodelae]